MTVSSEKQLPVLRDKFAGTVHQWLPFKIHLETPEALAQAARSYR
jgi:hypothetical protein